MCEAVRRAGKRASERASSGALYTQTPTAHMSAALPEYMTGPTRLSPLGELHISGAKKAGVPPETFM